MDGRVMHNGNKAKKKSTIVSIIKKHPLDVGSLVLTYYILSA